MWTKKSEEQLRKEKEKGRYSIVGPLGIFFGAIIWPILGKKMGLSKQVPGSNRALSWQEILSNIPEYLLSAFYLAVGLFIFQVLFLKKAIISTHTTNKICLSCYKIHHASAIKCDCGGTLDKLDNYKWIE